MVRNLKNIAWHPKPHRILSEFAFTLVLMAMFLVSPITALTHWLGYGYSPALWLIPLLTAPLSIAAMAITLYWERTNDNWWWVWCAGITMPMRSRISVSKMPFVTKDPEVQDWLATLPKWTYVTNYEHVSFLYRSDAMFYKLAYT